MKIRASLSNEETIHENEPKSINLIEDSDASTNTMNCMPQATASLVEKRKVKARLLSEIQEKNFKVWSKKDLKFRWKLSCHFSPTESIPSDFEYVMISDKDRLPKIDQAEWRILKKDSITRHGGLKLASRLYILTRPINLRSQSLKVEFDFVLGSDSQFNLISRSSLLSNEETTIFRFTRIDTKGGQRLMVVLAGIDTNTREIMLITKTELPIFKEKEEEMHIALTFIDGGSDLVVLNGIINKNLRNTFRVICDRLIVPFFEEFNLMFYGYGSSVTMQNFRLDIVDQVNSTTFKRNKEVSSCCYSQCNIF